MWYYKSVHGHMRRGLEHHLKSQPARILDAGCGSGGLIRRLAPLQPAWSWQGLDYSPLACALARERCTAEIREGSLLDLPYEDGRFAAITSVDVLCQVKDPRTALAEIHRCLAPGGTAVVNVPAYKWLWSYHDEAVQSEHRFTRPEMIALFREAGFRVLRSTYWNMLPFPLVVLRRKVFPPAHPTSDVSLFPRPVEAGFNALMAVEHAWLGTGGRLPFGSSVLTVAQKS